ncbi:uncharacterized protein [Amphiura filiformis]|uniref:uncharacterized protein n=1 Tax=Amphiura filiformis TaxID=82378 RepID=UPI003B21B985
MAATSHQLRTLAHKFLDEAECAELKRAISGFKKDKSVLLLCASLYKILSTPEKMQILLAVYPMIPQDLQRDFDSLCSLQFDYYATTLRPKIAEKYDKKTKGKHKATKESTKAAALLSIDQIRRFHTPRDPGPEVVKSSSATKDEVAASTSKGSRKNRELRHRRSPEQTRRHARGAQQQRKRSKTAHAVLGPAKVQSPRATKGQDPPKVPPPRVPPPRVPPLELDTSNVSSNTSANSSQRSSQHTPKNIPIRKVKLERRDGGSLGFAIRGGSDLNAGIYVSDVDAGGQAERRGLRVGERILKVNDTTFKNVSHSEAVAALIASRKVTIYVASVGLMPGTSPRSIGTPREVNTSRSTDSKKVYMYAQSQEESPLDAIKKVTVFADDDNYMGCSIRGGVDCGMDVMVAHVDPGSPAYKAGLKKGQCIIKVNDASVDTLTHIQVISLITATKVVIFEVKPGSKDKFQFFRKPKDSVAASSQYTSNHESVGTPRNNFDTQMSMDDFEKELMSTPPVSTSTPLPPEDHPLLLANRPAEFNNKHHIDDASILHLLQNGQVSQSNDDGNSEGPCGSVDQNKTMVQNNFDPKLKESKFDKGTIKLNMAEKDHKEMLKSAKIIDISIEPTSKRDRRRSHVKDIFKDNLKTEDLKTPGKGKSVRSESCRSPPRRPKTPQRDRAQSMNVLSTPYNKHKRVIEVTPPQNQLQDASSTANMQIKQELTGKRLLLSPNVPVAPNSPVSNFFRKVLHTDNSGDKNLRKISSLENFATHHGFEQSNMAPGISKWRSAYDFVTESDSDED